MYYLVYGLLYLISLLPLWILYRFSDLAYFILYYVVGYRKELVISNLTIAFPEKTEAEKVAIAKEFYLNFTDTFIESIKMISIGKKQLLKRSQVDVTYLKELTDRGLNVHILAGHQFNWEFANLAYSMHLKPPFVVVYMPVNNSIFDRIWYKIRARYGSVLVSVKEFRNKMHSIFSKQYILVLAADQNPGYPKTAFWMNFFGKPVPFITGPGKGAVKYNTAVVFIAFHKVRRGYYQFTTVPLTENGADHTPQELTMLYKKALEDTIRKQPSNYLWSHRRWRHTWQEDYPPILD